MITTLDTPTADAVELYLESQYYRHRARERCAERERRTATPDTVPLPEILLWLMAVLLVLGALGWWLS